MIRNQELEKERRLQQKTLDEAFKNSIQYGLSCSPFEVEAILEVVKEIYFPLGEDKEHVTPGKVRVSAVSADEPPGKPLKDCTMKPVTVTLFADEDNDYRRQHGVQGLRRKQVLRMAEEALEQGALLTLEDLAYRLLNCGMRTLNRDLKDLRQAGVSVPLRGAQKDIGRSITHRVQIVEAFLKRQTYTEISRNHYHSEHAIRNYVVTFCRVAMLSRKGTPIEDIAFLVQISRSLVVEYQFLLEKYLNHPDYRERTLEVVADIDTRLNLSGSKKGALK